MILLQLSSGQGPIECCQAIGLAIGEIEKQCRESGIQLSIIDRVEAKNAKQKHGFKSALLTLASTDDDTQAKQFAMSWQGSILWICQSNVRPKHKRKNWFFSGKVFEINENIFDKGISFQTCRASGAGGQHVNTTDSAVRATHTATGISVKAQSERSQHANKRIATALLFHKLEMIKLERQSAQDKARWQHHLALERGNPIRTFIGETFTQQA